MSALLVLLEGLAWLCAGLAFGELFRSSRRTDTPKRTRDAADLIDRALYDLAHDWPGAAVDALSRARRLLPEPATRGETS
jgi:hypothetical protein